MKTKHYLRHFFNMIEVSLALGVTAVGVLGAITILPIALKTTNSTTYAAYLSDAANMVFMGIDDHLNEACYHLDYDKEHKSDIAADDMQKINQKRKEAFAEFFKTNEDGAKNLNKELEIKSGSSTGVHIIHAKVGNHGIIAFYPEDPGVSIAVPDDYTAAFPNDIGAPLFATRYRIVVTNLENDEEYKSDGLRKLVEVNTEPVRIQWRDERTGKEGVTDVAGARVAGAKRFTEDLTKEELEEANKLMKRVYVEFSWPVNAEYKARSRKTFIKEYYMAE